MVKAWQAILSLLPLSPLEHPLRLASDHSWPPSPAHSPTKKSIAIVGAGSSGLAALKAILELPLELRQSWSVVLFEQRRDVGGIWLPDPVPPHPPVLPATPLYPHLRTNTPHPTMTYPGFPFPPMTPLYPSHHAVLAYHRNYSDTFGLDRYIRFNTTVLEAAWTGDVSKGVWEVQTRREREGNLQDVIEGHRFNHLIVASGHNHYPSVPEFPGSKSWLENSSPGKPSRSILHSIFYRDPHDYANKTVVVVGGGASGRDAASQVESIARKTYLSLKSNSTTQPINVSTAILKPRISHFTHDSVVFIDNTTASDVDSLILATGYELRIPFLEAGGVLLTNRTARRNNSSDDYAGLTTNLRYLFPLYESIFSLSSKLPSTALSFIGLPILIANCPSDRAQSLVVAHAIANNSLLASRQDLLAQLTRYETDLESRGFDPYYVGHRQVGENTSEDYQDRIVQFLKENGALPLDGRNFVEQWRRDARRDGQLLKRAWTRIESQGKMEEAKWLQGVDTEEEWAHLLDRMGKWQRAYEEEQGEVIHPFYNGV
ncbi:FAD/NAD(P)-binding domain-containing protein [Ramaria rubella]|nr:FAD/NAD(P)-binding domain-containing protein [Ramaria rubella]